MTPEEITNRIKRFDPDVLYGPENNAVTFIYDINDKAFYHDVYPTNHWGLLTDYQLNDDVRINHMYDDCYDKGLMLGRLGIYEELDIPLSLILLWLKCPEQIIKEMLEKIIQELPEDLNYGEAYFSDRSHVFKISDLIGNQKNQSTPQHPMDSPECKGTATVNIHGKPTTAQEILSALHMVRGQAKSELQSSFCSQYKNLFSKLSSKNCPIHMQMINAIAKQMDCSNVEKEYDRMKKDGRYAYRQELKKIFSNPAELEKRFRTQKELNAAWDELQYGKKECVDFKDWLNYDQAKINLKKQVVSPKDIL